ncbi:MerR family transcriptional regulator [Rhodococcoides fascians A21d2]|uniref:MerR family transcriptional regulator n=1 Tax=Nocardiaceae TaxID=85025 RepID=UPI000561E37F|nr:MULTISPECIES: MerR family transcriptional regulator [Rhodococcus]OZE85241.1 MerR family transcriptional regulator [Rhodococcus sp. 15-649-2-2]QIH99521.1 MerR family transcriptional regulator [Rhodococcus fascians A21d2]
MKIGEVALELDVPTHVLRHWDDVGVVVPERLPSGHRDYSAEHVRRLRVLQACQGVGISLADIRLILHRDELGRTAVIEEQLARIRRQQAQLDHAERFLTHVVSCTHDLLTRCAQCSEYSIASTPPP